MVLVEEFVHPRGYRRINHRQLVDQRKRDDAVHEELGLPAPPPVAVLGSIGPDHSLHQLPIHPLPHLRQIRGEPRQPVCGVAVTKHTPQAGSNHTFRRRDDVDKRALPIPWGAFTRSRRRMC
jgi:hypothetical protein